MFKHILPYCKTTFIGMLVGIANIIPGVSGGTIAVVTGVYDPLIESISQYLPASFKQKRHYTLFLTQIILGASISIILLSKVIEKALTQYNEHILFFFIGLILGSVPLLLKQNKIKVKVPNQQKLFSIIWLINGIALPILMIFLPESTNNQNNIIYLSLSGFIAAAAMILPGLSGSLMFLILGTYQPIITAINERNLLLISYVGIGAIAGLLSLSKLIHYCLKTFSQYSYCFIIGLMLGSCVNIWPNLSSPNFIAMLIYGICGSLGFFIALQLDRLK